MALEAGLGKKDNARYAAKFQCRFTLKYQFALNRYRTVCRLRAMRIFALEFILENEELSRKGAERNGTHSPVANFFSVLHRLNPNFHGISVVDFQETDKFRLQSREYGRCQKICSDKATYK